jgi:diguanylate cyclase (GGDEF)-like protein
VAYGRASGAFRAEHVHSLQALADEAASGLASARRFAAAERHAETDPATGARNRTGYEAELEREVARARRTGRPLSVLLLQVGDGSGGSSANRALPEVAAMLSRLTRATDSLCRPREHELAVLLPGTKGTGARRFFARVRDEASATLPDVSPLTVSAGLVEWRPDETSESLAERVATAVRTVDTLPGPGSVEVVDDEAPPARPSFRGTLADEVARAQRESEPLTLLVVDLDAAALAGGRTEDAESARAEVTARLDEIVTGRGSSGSLGSNRFAAVLAATVTDAETAIAVLRESLRTSPPALVGPVTVFAGITELVPGDDVGSIVGRAERAVDQARQAGDGTVVVATANGTH